MAEREISAFSEGGFRTENSRIVLVHACRRSPHPARSFDGEDIARGMAFMGRLYKLSLLQKVHCAKAVLSRNMSVMWLVCGMCGTWLVCGMCGSWLVCGMRGVDRVGM